MAIPEQSTVLVVGGGPGGSFAASALAREGISTVLLEADVFPRYHIGESMLASMRHFLRFIDLDSTFDKYGFKIKKGAAFKLNAKPPGYTDFTAAGGPDGYAWNVIRSESDELMFKHAAKSGAQVFDGVKVKSIDFEDSNQKAAAEAAGLVDPGKPVSATWSRKDGSTGSIRFDYLVDASGRAGVVSTKYLKNRQYNQGLKNVAMWGYWKGASQYAPGTLREGQPYFEALSDANGWVWIIPLHNDTVSVGVVMNQQVSAARKKAMGSPSSKEFYQEALKLTPGILELLENAELVSEVKNASDWSYSATSYASPNVRIVGDAGCFIDPFFSSGVHLALASALSAAVTICAARRGEIGEIAAAKWHSKKVGEGYTRFLLVVLSVLKQIRQKDEPVLSDWDENGFDHAFSMFRPIIQGHAETSKTLSQDEISKTVNFCCSAFRPVARKEREAVLEKLEKLDLNEEDVVNQTGKAGTEKLEECLSPNEMGILNTMRARQMMRSEDMINIENFGADAIDGMSPNIVRGSLGLIKAEKLGPHIADDHVDVLAVMMREEGTEDQIVKEPMHAESAQPIMAH